MKSAPVAFGLVIAVFLGGAVVRAQSLSDIAKKEEERRKAAKPGGKVYTNDDLKQYPAPPPAAAPAQTAPDGSKPATPAAGEQAAPDAAKGPDAAKAAEAGEQKDEAYWKALIGGERTKLERNRGYLEALQSQVNGLTNDFYSRDDPAQRSVIWTRRTKALEEMDRLKKEVDDGVKAIAKIEEDARKAGVPPGWVR